MFEIKISQAAALRDQRNLPLFRYYKFFDTYVCMYLYVYDICPYCNEFQVYTFGLMIYFILYSIGKTLPNRIVYYIRVRAFTRKGMKISLRKTGGTCNPSIASMLININTQYKYAKLDLLKKYKRITLRMRGCIIFLPYCHTL